MNIPRVMGKSRLISYSVVFMLLFAYYLMLWPLFAGVRPSAGEGL